VTQKALLVVCVRVFWPLICLFYECLELGVAECCIGIDVISSTVVLL